MTERDIVTCNRCKVKLQVAPMPGSKARILLRADSKKGYCINCAAHDWLRNTYPVNILLARSGPKGLALPHIQRQFYDIALSQKTDAAFDEIDWNKIIANWDLPWPTKVERRAENPHNEEDIARLLEHERAYEADGLTEQEKKAKHRAELDHAVRDLINVLNPKSKNKKFKIREDHHSVTVFVENDDE